MCHPSPKNRIQKMAQSDFNKTFRRNRYFLDDLRKN